MNYKVGQDIEAICRKCGDVFHVVVALTGNTIAKVQCKQCGGLHRYKPSDPIGGISVSKSKTSSRLSSKAGAKQKFKETEVIINPLLPVKPYSIHEHFFQGETVEHAKFGLGVVEIVMEDKKIQVHFNDGRRVLAHER